MLKYHKYFFREIVLYLDCRLNYQDLAYSAIFLNIVNLYNKVNDAFVGIN